MRMQHEESMRRLCAKCLDRRAAGIARCRANDRDPLAALGERPVHHRREKLHGHVLEGERRPVKELEQPQIGIESA